MTEPDYPASKEDYLEVLARVEHALWREQIQAVLSQLQSELVTATEGTREGQNVLALFGSLSCVQLWQRDASRTFGQLSETTKEARRAEAERRRLIKRDEVTKLLRRDP